jgi:hypothetical protein
MTAQQDDFFGSLFEHRDQRLDRLDNTLVELDANIGCEAFRPLLDRLEPRCENRQPAGSPGTSS